MTFYTLYPNSKNTSFAFYLKGNNIDDILDYFNFNLNDKFLLKPRIYLTFDEKFEKLLPKILADDFYFCASGLLLFSNNFVKKTHQLLINDGQFFECLLNNSSCDIYAFYIKNSIDITLQSESNETNTVCQIFRDINKPYIYGVNQTFIDFIQQNKLNVKALKYTSQYLLNIE